MPARHEEQPALTLEETAARRGLEKPVMRLLKYFSMAYLKNQNAARRIAADVAALHHRG